MACLHVHCTVIVLFCTEKIPFIIGWQLHPVGYVSDPRDNEGIKM